MKPQSIVLKQDVTANGIYRPAKSIHVYGVKALRDFLIEHVPPNEK